MPRKIKEVQKDAGFMETLRRDMDTSTRSVCRRTMPFHVKAEFRPACTALHATAHVRHAVPVLYTNKRPLRFKLNLSFAENGV